MNKVLSGMRPTGRLHLGHYFGALKNWVELQNKFNNQCYYMIADWHALTTEYDNVDRINKNTLEMLADWISIGIDPKKSIIFKQSEVPLHSELFLILTMITPLNWLYRCPTYKEQIKEIKNKNLKNFGFLGYPILMSADILLYRANIVPVGKDQLAHLEFTREIVRRFNSFYGKMFDEPIGQITKYAKIPGIDGRKMSKSYNNSILLGEDIDVLNYKVKNMFTDPLKIRKTDKGHFSNCVVFAFLKAFDENCENLQKNCENGTISCMQCKKQLMEIISEFIKPLNKKRIYLLKNKSYLNEILKEGCQKAAIIATETIKDVRNAIKL